VSTRKKSPSDEWWVRIGHEFQSHVREELHFLERYEQAVLETDDPAARFLLHMILRDEHLHHELFEEMTHQVLGEDGSGVVGASGVPSPSPELARRLLEPTERFLEAERDDRKRLKKLAKELEPLQRESMWPLLVSLMVTDTEKHVRILEFLLDRLRDAAGR
jgi:rubrerythrin